MTQPPKPTRQEFQAAAGATLTDVIAPGLDGLFCGINPGLYSGATGHHFARPGNRFWPALHAAGITDRVLAPHEERKLLDHGFGITNFVARATARASELGREELVAGRRRLEAKVAHYRPRVVAVLGIGAYRKAFGRRQVALGLQPERLGGAHLWLLPNPSGLNAHYQLDDLARLFAELKEWVE